MIRDLQDADIGDPKRLAYILTRIKNDRTIYNSDKNYVQERFRHMRDATDRVSETIPELFVARKEDPVLSTNVAVSGPGKVWYILPILLGVLGGLIAYALIRKKKKKSSNGTQDTLFGSRAYNVFCLDNVYHLMY